MDEIRLVAKDELMHYGVKGMKWGVRQNRDVRFAKLDLKTSKMNLKGAKRAGDSWDVDQGRKEVRYYKDRYKEVKKEARNTQKNLSQDHVRAKELKKKKLSQLSNAELKELNNRMNLESQYKNLKRQNISAGRKFIQDVARETAKNTASEYARKYAKKGISYVAGKRS